MLLSPAPAEAILGFGKKKKSIVPSEAEMVGQHSEANQMYAEAQQLQNSGSDKKARGLYKSIIKQFPLTTAAAHSQFQLGALLEKANKPKKAFEEYQEFINAYKDNDLFKEALKRQYHIANYYLENQKSGFLGFGANIQPSKLIEFFTQISINAPYSQEAPKSLFNVGVVNSRTGKIDESLLAYASVVERYPGTPIAAKAQYEIVQLLGSTGDKSYNPANSRQHREAAEDFLNQYGGDALASDVKAELGKLEDKDLEKSFNIGRFYEKQGKYRSAAVYYQEVIAHPGSQHYDAAKARLGNLAEHDPSIVRKTGTPRRVETPPKLSKRKDYHGPPPPKLDSSSPRMRTSPADVTPISAPPASPTPKTEN
ncbi:MAG: tetratricopeptide repeat protein [Verrucomicrobiales bacterium]|nr:tetratricopeptide repeat protein [Verrucomicrobiales bacterium]